MSEMSAEVQLVCQECQEFIAQNMKQVEMLSYVDKEPG